MRYHVIPIIVILLIAQLTTASRHRFRWRKDWVARSDRNSEVLLEVMARFNPEGAGFLGIEGLDEEILQLGPLTATLRQIEALGTAVAELRSPPRAGVRPSKVRLDLEILIDSAELNIRRIRRNGEHLLPYVNVPQDRFSGGSFVARRTEFTGATRGRRGSSCVATPVSSDGFTPIFEQSEALIRSRLSRLDLIGPYPRRARARSHRLGSTTSDGIRDLLATFEVAGGDTAVEVLEQPGEALQTIFSAPKCYRGLVRSFRLPPEIYALLLENMGIDMPVSELVSRAQVSFREIQNEMQVIAILVAREPGTLKAPTTATSFATSRSNQLVGDEILTTYSAQDRGAGENSLKQHVSSHASATQT